MNNNNFNITYLALELTKIYANINTQLTSTDIFSIYNDYLLKLTDSINTIEHISQLESQLEKLKQENEVLQERNKQDKQALLQPVVNLVEQGKSDMEPYLYKALIDTCVIV